MRWKAQVLILICTLGFGVASIAMSCSSLATACFAQKKTAPPPIEFLGAWGTKGTGPGLLGNPRSIATDTFGDVFVADAGTPTKFVHKFRHDGHPLLSFEPLAAIHNPCAMTVDSGGAIYVLECGAGELYMFYPDGTFMHGIRGGIAAPAKPTSVAVDDVGRLYVSETHTNRILKYTPNGRLLGALSASPNPHADNLIAGPEGGLYAAQCAPRFITKMSVDGLAEKEWVWGQSARDGERCFLAATQKFVVALTGPANSPVLRVYTLDGQEKISKALAEVDPSLVGVDCVSVAATRDGEVFILDVAGVRVIRLRLNL